MKRVLKPVSAVLLLAVVATMLFGCANFEKKAAFSDYGKSLEGDVAIMNDLQDGLNQINSTSDMTTMKAVMQAKINPNLVKLSTSASARHSAITDTEIAAIDAHYVNFTKHMSDAFAFLLDGINTQDNAKLTKFNSEMDVAMSEMKQYADSMQSFIDKYGIKDDGSLAAARAMMSGY